jgi:hypothetical protein
MTVIVERRAVLPAIGFEQHWLPSRKPMRKSRNDELWLYPFASILDAIEPNDLRILVRWAN